MRPKQCYISTKGRKTLWVKGENAGKQCLQKPSFSWSSKVGIVWVKGKVTNKSLEGCYTIQLFTAQRQFLTPVRKKPL